MNIQLLSHLENPIKEPADFDSEVLHNSKSNSLLEWLCINECEVQLDHSLDFDVDELKKCTESKFQRRINVITKDHPYFRSASNKALPPFTTTLPYRTDYCTHFCTKHDNLMLNVSAVGEWKSRWTNAGRKNGYKNPGKIINMKRQELVQVMEICCYKQYLKRIFVFFSSALEL